MKQNKNAFKKTAKIFNHKGFIAISMFSLGLFLPAMMPAFKHDFFNKDADFPPMPSIPSIAQGCHTQTSADGETTTQCMNQVVQNTVNSINSGSANPVTVNLPKLPKFCKYVSGSQGITVSCNSPLPSNLPISIPPIKPIQIALPTLPSNCQYQTGSGTPSVHCTAITGNPQITFTPKENSFEKGDISITPSISPTQHKPVASFFSSIAKFFFGFGK